MAQQIVLVLAVQVLSSSVMLALNAVQEAL
jgi:hypothetical protein